MDDQVIFVIFLHSFNTNQSTLLSMYIDFTPNSERLSTSYLITILFTFALSKFRGQRHLHDIIYNFL